MEEGLAAARRQCDASETATSSKSKSGDSASSNKSKKSSDAYNSLLPGGAIAQLAMDPYVESYGAGDDDDEGEDYYGGYDYADPYAYAAYGYEDMMGAGAGEEDTSTTMATTTEGDDDGNASSAPDGQPIVYGTPIVPQSRWVAEPTNPYPHVPLNVDHCVIDPIKETSPSLSLSVLSKVTRSTVYVPPAAADAAQAVPDATAAALANPETTPPMSKKALAKAAKPGPTVLPPGKNPIQFLNEQMPGLPFECVSRIGADNKPTFTMKVRNV